MPFIQGPYSKRFKALTATGLLLFSCVAASIATDPHARAVEAAPNGTSAGTPAVARPMVKHVVNMRAVPSASAVAKASPAPTAADTADAANANSAADSADAQAGDAQTTQFDPLANKETVTNVPQASYVYQLPGATGKSSGKTPGNPAPQMSAMSQTAPLTTSFQGMSDSTSICPPSGCNVPDGALATSSSWVFQGVNTSFAVYNTAGALQPGWPKTAQSFFGVPNPPPYTSPYLIDVRAMYDPNDGRFWASIVQNENAFGRQPSAAFMARLWVAVSQTSDPNGQWNVYSFDMAQGTTNGADFPEIGFDSQAFYFSANMWDQAGKNFLYSEIFAASKALMESGAAVTPAGFSNLQLNGVPVDSVQPVESLVPSGSGPGAGIFINSLNYKFGAYGTCSNGCKGVVVWSMANPTSSTPTLTSVLINTPTYTRVPWADQPGCTKCLGTDQTEITATPVYSGGSIWFSLNTAINNGTQTVPGILWGQVTPSIDASGVVTTGTLNQSGYLDFSGDTAAYYGAIIPDVNGNVAMVFEMSSSTINPQTVYVTRPSTLAPGQFADSGAVLRAGDAKTTERFWGDYNAVSYDGFSTNNLWFVGEYSPASGLWSTYIGETVLGPSSSPTPTPTPLPTATPAPTATATPAPTATATPAPTATATAAPCTTPTITFGAASATPATLSAGSSVTLTATLTASCAISASIVDFEVMSAGGSRVFQIWWDKQPLSGQAQTFSVAWPTPTGLATGTYTVNVNVYASGGFTTLYGQNPGAATFTIQ